VVVHRFGGDAEVATSLLGAHAVSDGLKDFDLPV
jgi:hypothetical protein